MKTNHTNTAPICGTKKLSAYLVKEKASTLFSEERVTLDEKGIT